MAKNPSRSLITPEFRMGGWPTLIEPKKYVDPVTKKEGDKESYSVEAIFTDADLEKFSLFNETTKSYEPVPLPRLLAQLAAEAWPDLKHPMTGEPETIKAMFERQAKGWPIMRGDLKVAKLAQKGKNGEHYAGMRTIMFKSNKSDKMPPPPLSMKTGPNTKVDLNRVNDADMAKAKLLFRGGNYAFATVTFQAQVVSGIHYLVPYLNGIRYTREGKRLGGFSEMDRFDGTQGGSSDHDPTAGMDEEIPF